MWKLILPLLTAGALAGCGGEGRGTGPDPNAIAPAETQVLTGPEWRILAFGNSLFAGYGVAPEESYPAELEELMQARGINATVTNAGVSGDTTAAGLERLDYVLENQEERPDLVILELGGNDLLRGIPPMETRENLAAMLEKLRGQNIPVLLMGMRAPPNLGETYAAEFDAIYPELAAEHRAALVPFFLAPVYNRPELIQPDRIHPTEEGIDALVAATMNDVLKALPEVSSSERGGASGPSSPARTHVPNRRLAVDLREGRGLGTGEPHLGIAIAQPLE